MVSAQSAIRALLFYKAQSSALQSRLKPPNPQVPIWTARHRTPVEHVQNADYTIPYRTTPVLRRGLILNAPHLILNWSAPPAIIPKSTIWIITTFARRISSIARCLICKMVIARIAMLDILSTMGSVCSQPQEDRQPRHRHHQALEIIRFNCLLDWILLFVITFALSSLDLFLLFCFLIILVLFFYITFERKSTLKSINQEYTFGGDPVHSKSAHRFFEGLMFPFPFHSIFVS